MKLQLLSDLHMEGRPFTLKVHPEADAIVLAGDIATSRSSHRLEKVLNETMGLPTFFVYGNHEYYRSSIPMAKDGLKKATKAFENFHILDDSYVDMLGHRFVGGTLWTDFRLPIAWEKDKPAYPAPEVSKQLAVQGITDFRVIAGLAPDDLVQMHAKTRAAISSAKQIDMPVVVITHFLPSPKSIHSTYARSQLNPYFCSNCEDLMGGNVKAWLHGHTHSHADYWHEGTHVVCNPRGYDGYENPQFKSTMLVEI